MIFCLLCASLALGGCHTYDKAAGLFRSDPVMTGKPQDWLSHDAEELRAAWGEPNRIIPRSVGSEVWEYVKAGEMLSPAKDETRFNAGGTPLSGVSGQIDTVKHSEHVGRYENIYRFSIKDGKVKKWYAARIVDGKTIWEDD